MLKSWAVPKGPSTDPSQKRLAIPAEDHPLVYADFEGVIPEHEYGGCGAGVGPGGYRNLKDPREGKEEPKSVSQQLEEGHATIWLEGEKLSGGYAMIRTGQGANARWLLIKNGEREGRRSAGPNFHRARVSQDRMDAGGNPYGARGKH